MCYHPGMGKNTPASQETPAAIEGCPDPASEIKRLRRLLRLHTPSLEAMLKRRGFSVYKKEISADLLAPSPVFVDGYYEMMKRYSFRLFLRDVIKTSGPFTPKGIARYATAEVTQEYTAYMHKTGLLEKTGNSYELLKHIRSFGETLEWFLAETFRREFEAEAVWGVRFKRPMVGGDYDLIAKIDASLLYMEVKSSPPKQIYQNEISAFVDRVKDLVPAISVFFMDTELRMKDKIVPMFEEELAARKLPGAPERIAREIFLAPGGIYIINAKGTVAANIGTVLGHYFRSRV